MPDALTPKDRPGRNPFIGPRPFETKDQDNFFGRDAEARSLIPLVIAERIALFYAESGAGKSSLINARLIPGLRERNFKVLPVSRVSGQSAASAQAENVFAHNLLVSLDSQSGGQGERLAGLTISEYLAEMDVEVQSGGRGEARASGSPEAAAQPVILDAPQVVDGVYPIALIIDQFEEIFTTHPEAWKEREPFFRQLSQAMEDDPYLWVILVMREDFVANLDPYLYLLPGSLRARFYMQRMSNESALQAVRIPAERGGRPFDPGVAEDLVSNLRMVAVGMGQDGQPSYAEGQFVEPVQLQVVCYQLWEQLEQEEGATSITAEDLNRLAKGKDLAQFISSALADFYNQAIASVMERFPETSERKLRDFFSHELITETRTRGLVFKGEKSSGDLPNEVLNFLESKFIIRTENRGASTWFEIVHDRFVDPILQANQDWASSNPRPYQADAEAWLKSGRDPKMLYDGKRLSEALNKLNSAPDELSEEETEFIRASKESQEKVRGRRQRILLIVAGLIAVAMIVLAGFAFSGQLTANAQRLVADSQRAAAQAAQAKEAEQRKLAETARAEADQQKNAALAAQAKEAEQRKAAEAAQAEAETQRQEAVKQKNAAETAQKAAEVAQKAAQDANILAQAGRLASLSDYFRDKNLPLSLLMAVGGVELKDTWETRQSLLDSLQVGLTVRLDKDGLPLSSKQTVSSIAYNPSGDLIAVGLFGGIVRIAHSDGHGIAATPPDSFQANGPVNSVSFSSQGDYLSSAGDDGKVRIWKMGDADVYDSFGPFQDKYVFPSIQAVAFQPGGNILAIATAKSAADQLGHVVLYDTLKKSIQKDLTFGANNCVSLAWSPDGKNLAIGMDNGALQIWGADQGAIVHDLGQPHSASIRSLSWYPDGQRMVSGGLDKRLILWNVPNESIMLRSNQDETPVVLSLSVSANGRYIVVGSNDSKALVTVWDAETLKPFTFDVLSTGNSQSVNSVAANPKGDRFASGGMDARVVFWKFNPVSPLVKTLDFSLNTSVDNRGTTMGLGQLSSGEYVQAQKVDEQTIKVWTQNKDAALKLSFSPASLAFGSLNGQAALILGGADGTATVVDQTTGKTINQLKIFSGTLTSVAMSPDGKYLAGVGCLTSRQNCNTLVLWDRDANQAVEVKADLKSLNVPAITSLVFSLDGKTLAFGTRDSRIYFYDLAAGTLQQLATQGLNLQGSSLDVTSLAFSPSEAGVFAAGFRDGRIALWAEDTLDPIGEYANRMNGVVTGLVFSRSSGDNLWTLGAASDNGEVWVYQVDKTAWLQRACQLAGRTLTPEEQTQFIPATSGLTADKLCPSVSP